jgi:hypothetical protein
MDIVVKRKSLSTAGNRIPAPRWSSPQPSWYAD